MANREALRELQARLASRLQTARATGTSVAWLAVHAGGSNYLLPLSQSGEIVPFTQYQPVPYACAWFRGVVNVRGGLYGVVDLTAFLAAISGQTDAATAALDTVIVTLNPALDVNCALQVDSLSGLRGPEAFAHSRAPAAGSPSFFGNVLVESTGLAWQEIDLRALALSPQFLSISV